MAVTATDWFNFAGSVIGRDEIADRSAASRAYYGAFHLCTPLADKLPAPPPLPHGREGGTHDRTIRAMQEFPVRGNTRARDMEIRKLGILMAQCRSLRTKADYKISADFPYTDAQEALRLAEAVATALQSIVFP